jgi:hypothetical protein
MKPWQRKNKCVRFIGGRSQISAVTFFAKTRTKVAIKNLLGEPGVEAVEFL